MGAKNKGKGGGNNDDSGKGGKGGGLKPATSINVRHILVRLPAQGFVCIAIDIGC